MAKCLRPGKLKIAKDFVIPGKIWEFSCKSIKIQENFKKIPSL